MTGEDQTKTLCECKYNNIEMTSNRKRRYNDTDRSNRSGIDLVIEDIIKTYGINTIRKLFNENYYGQLDQFINLLASTDPGQSSTKNNLKKKFDTISKDILIEDSKRIFKTKIVPVTKDLVTYIKGPKQNDEIVGGSYFDDNIETEQEYDDYYGLNVKSTIKPLNFEKLFKKL